MLQGMRNQHVGTCSATRRFCFLLIILKMTTLSGRKGKRKEKSIHCESTKMRITTQKRRKKNKSFHSLISYPATWLFDLLIPMLFGHVVDLIRVWYFVSTHWHNNTKCWILSKRTEDEPSPLFWINFPHPLHFRNYVSFGIEIESTDREPFPSLPPFDNPMCSLAYLTLKGSLSKLKTWEFLQEILEKSPFLQAIKLQDSDLKSWIGDLRLFHEEEFRYLPQVLDSTLAGKIFRLDVTCQEWTPNLNLIIQNLTYLKITLLSHNDLFLPYFPQVLPSVKTFDITNKMTETVSILNSGPGPLTLSITDINWKWKWKWKWNPSVKYLKVDHLDLIKKTMRNPPRCLSFPLHNLEIPRREWEQIKKLYRGERLKERFNKIVLF